MWTITWLVMMMQTQQLSSSKIFFSRGGFLFRKWDSNEASVHTSEFFTRVERIKKIHPIADANDYTKALGLEWNTTTIISS